MGTGIIVGKATNTMRAERVSLPPLDNPTVVITQESQVLAGYVEPGIEVSPNGLSESL